MERDHDGDPHGFELPVTLSYRTFLWSGWVPEIGDRP